ncbi:hypothetical protein JDV02_009015 [Purpureocillium takamizusanense]|uniref:Mid2 domain-containing protein n=1 Tax=Purpureocillium takamizusanense TaxID=2060973 RepID=A0A9Q8VDU8_9HYPO|nr:uncharacterized protein JDV02_009015 [Purpureocillium takamizusanense]UNI23180.1 hypothetical protein JDV02_009015 [Purpureocillium takamizusanense]
MKVRRGDILYYVTLTITRDGTTRYTTILLGTKTTGPQGSITQTPTPPEETAAGGESPSDSSSSGGRDSAQTALIVVGVLLGVVVILALVWWCCIRPFRNPVSPGSSTTYTSSRSSTPSNNPDIVPPMRPPSPVYRPAQEQERKGRIYERGD